MKRPFYLPALLLTVSLAAAEPEVAPAPTAVTPASPAPATATPATTPSSEVAQKLSEVLPKYNPPDPEEKAPAPADPDALVLPTMTVRQRARPRLDPQLIVGNAAFNEQLAKEKTSDFDRNFLNKFGWLGGATAAERAREDYEREKKAEFNREVATVAKAVEQIDAGQAQALREAASKP